MEKGTADTGSGNKTAKRWRRWNDTRDGQNAGLQAARRDGKKRRQKEKGGKPNQTKSEITFAKKAITEKAVTDRKGSDSGRKEHLTHGIRKGRELRRAALSLFTMCSAN